MIGIEHWFTQTKDAAQHLLKPHTMKMPPCPTARCASEGCLHLRWRVSGPVCSAGMPTVEIRQNLGHARQETTLSYIGTRDAARRRPPAIYSFDLANLAKVPIQLKQGI